MDLPEGQRARSAAERRMASQGPAKRSAKERSKPKTQSQMHNKY
jgi:hypothetical protein